MNNAIFTEALTLSEDNRALCQAIREGLDTMKQITAAAGQRIESEREAAADRITALEERSGDPERPEAVRRLALRELEQVRGQSFTLSEDEREAFAAVLEEVETAQRDAGQVQRKLMDALREARAELDRIRKAAYSIKDGGGDLDLIRNGTESAKNDFFRLEG